MNKPDPEPSLGALMIDGVKLYCERAMLWDRTARAIDDALARHAVARGLASPRSLRDDGELTQTIADIDGLLFRGDLSDAEERYLDALTDAVERYEAEHCPIPDAPVADVIRLLLDGHNLTPDQLASDLGWSFQDMRSIMAGDRVPRPDEAKVLGVYFGVDPVVFTVQGIA